MCIQGFPGGSVIKNLPANAGDTGSIPGLGRSPGKGNGNPLQYSYLEIPRTEDPGGLQSMRWQKSRTWLSDYTTSPIPMTIKSPKSGIKIEVYGTNAEMPTTFSICWPRKDVDNSEQSHPGTKRDKRYSFLPSPSMCTQDMTKHNFESLSRRWRWAMVFFRSPFTGFLVYNAHVNKLLFAFPLRICLWSV